MRKTMCVIVLAAVLLALPACCVEVDLEEQSPYTTKTVQTLDGSVDIAALFYEADEYGCGLTVKAYMVDESVKPLFSINSWMPLVDRPQLLLDGDTVYVLISGQDLYDTGVYQGKAEPDPEGLNRGGEGDISPGVFAWHMRSGKFERLAPDNPEESLLLDGFLADGKLAYLYERRRKQNGFGQWADSIGGVSTLKNPLDFKIVGNSPLVIKACVDTSFVYFPAIGGIYRVGLQDGAVSKCLDTDYSMCDFVQIMKLDDGFIVLAEETGPYDSQLARPASVRVQRLDGGFHTVKSAGYAGRLDFTELGGKGVMACSLAKTRDGYVLYSTYIRFDDFYSLSAGKHSFVANRNNDTIEIDLFGEDRAIEVVYLDDSADGYLYAPAWHFLGDGVFVLIDPATSRAIGRYCE